MDEFDQDTTLANVAELADRRVGTIGCTAAACNGRVPVYADKRATECDTCGALVMFT